MSASQCPTKKNRRQFGAFIKKYLAQWKWGSI